MFERAVELFSAPGGAGSAEVAHALGESRDIIDVYAGRAVGRGLLRKIHRGRYGAPNDDPHEDS